MKKRLLLNRRKITYADVGTGKVIILLHGYLESIEVWNNFSSELSKSFRVVCFDIPGHGDSEILSEKHSIQQIASIIYDCLNTLNIDKVFMIGHSMGGYITLMFHKLFPEKLFGFSLLHSHPYSDNKTTVKKRLREIELVKDGKKDLIAKVNIPNAFATSNLGKFKTEVKKTIEIALQTSENGIIANLHAMMNRPDLSESLKKTEIPFLYIAGKNDNYIDFEKVASKIQLSKESKFCTLDNSGHMGFIEEMEESVKIILDFIKQTANQLS